MSSRSRHIEVVCPECQAPNPFLQWVVVDSVENPEAVDAILDGSLFDFTCRNCEEEITLDFSIRFEDHYRERIVQYDAPRQAELEKPPAPKPSYKLRFVHDQNAFIEVVRITKDGLEDYVMLVLKHWLANGIEKSTGQRPLLCSYMAVTLNPGPEKFEYAVLLPGEHEAHSTTGEPGYMDLVVRLALCAEELMPNGEWVAWNHETAQRLVDACMTDWEG